MSIFCVKELSMVLKDKIFQELNTNFKYNRKNEPVYNSHI